jgi:hypothetical protein
MKPQNYTAHCSRCQHCVKCRTDLLGRESMARAISEALAGNELRELYEECSTLATNIAARNVLRLVEVWREEHAARRKIEKRRDLIELWIPTAENPSPPELV